jgi:hypothetical protein
MQGKGKGSVSSFSSEKYDVFYSRKSRWCLFLTKQRSTVRQFMQLTELVTVDVVVVLPYVQAKGNATDQVLTNLENERKGLQDVSVFVKYSPFNFNFGSSSLRLIGALGLKHRLVIIKLKKVFNLLLLLEIEALQ